MRAVPVDDDLAFEGEHFSQRVADVPRQPRAVEVCDVDDQASIVPAARLAMSR